MSFLILITSLCSRVLASGETFCCGSMPLAVWRHCREFHSPNRPSWVDISQWRCNYEKETIPTIWEKKGFLSLLKKIMFVLCILFSTRYPAVYRIRVHLDEEQNTFLRRGWRQTPWRLPPAQSMTPSSSSVRGQTPFLREEPTRKVGHLCEHAQLEGIR